MSQTILTSLLFLKSTKEIVSIVWEGLMGKGHQGGKIWTSNDFLTFYPSPPSSPLFAARRMFNEEHPLEILVDSASDGRYSKLVLRDNTDGSIQVS